MKVSKKMALSVALLLSLQISALADSSRVEQYHQQKHQKQVNTHRNVVNQQSSRPVYRQPHRYTNVQQQRVRPVNRPFTQRRVIRPHRVIPPNHRIGYRVNSLHRNAYHFRHGGRNYRYDAGVFYRPYSHGYRVVRAPIGALILSLPIGFTTFLLGHNYYYYYNDVYYTRDARLGGYRVVNDPYLAAPAPVYNRYPAGTMVEALPYGAVEVIIDNVRYYEYGTQYFRPQRRNGVLMYLVVDF